MRSGLARVNGGNAEGAPHDATESSPGETAHPTVEDKPRAFYERIVRLRANRLAGQAIPPTLALVDRIEERCRSLGETTDQATLAVVEDLERAATTINLRTAPLVATSGLVVGVAGLLDKFTEVSHVLAPAAIILAVVGLSFSVLAIFTHAGRRAVGLAPTQEDVAFARARLLKKEANAQIGSAVSGLGVLVLIAALLTI